MRPAVRTPGTAPHPGASSAPDGASPDGRRRPTRPRPASAARQEPAANVEELGEPIDPRVQRFLRFMAKMALQSLLREQEERRVQDREQDVSSAEEEK